MKKAIITAPMLLWGIALSPKCLLFTMVHKNVAV